MNRTRARLPLEAVRRGAEASGRKEGTVPESSVTMGPSPTRPIRRCTHVREEVIRWRSGTRKCARRA
jgi:hypothetical protein